MKETRKWSWITLICVLVIGSLVALDLKYHYDSDQNNHRTNNKVQINNKMSKSLRILLIAMVILIAN